MNNTQKILKWTVTPFLTVGAVLLLGLLAFTGMYVLYPIISLAIAIFALSVIYEGEIYQQNISSALDKLLDKNILMQTLGKNILLDLEKTYDKNNTNNPMFLNNYFTLKKSKKKSAGDRERLKKMELWIAKIILQRDSIAADHQYAQDVLSLVDDHFPTDDTDWNERHDRLRFYNLCLIALSSTGAIIMSLGTIYLLIDTFSILTFISLTPAIAPFVIVPLSIIAGIAYGFLTYNSLSDFIFESDLFEWLKNIKEKFSNPETYQDPKNIAIAIFGVLVIALNVGLTICTAGTWWTIMNQSRPVWGWLQNGFVKILERITPFVIALTTAGFNIPNTAETIKEMLPEEDAEQNSCEASNVDKSPAPFNPFDYLLKFVYFPFRLLMFIGHLISVSVTADQMPGIPQIMAASFAFISEFLEDGHYFLDMEEIKEILGLKNDECTDHDHDHDHGHQHSDIPNYILQFIFSPLFLSAAAYDYYFNQVPEQPQDFKTCLYKKLKWKDKDSTSEQPDNTIVGHNWLREEAIMIMDEQLEHLKSSYWHSKLITKKIEAIDTYKNTTLNDIDEFRTLQNHPDLKTHRSWGFFSKTRSEEMIDALSPLAEEYSNISRSFATVDITNDLDNMDNVNSNTTIHYSPVGGVCVDGKCTTCNPLKDMQYCGDVLPR